MTKTEEALCNGITFSVPRMVPTSIQEGELENASYYVIVYLAPTLDKIVMKFYEAPSYKPLKWDNVDIEGIHFILSKLSDSDSENPLVGYNFGHPNDGEALVYPGGNWFKGNPDQVYNGLMLYPGLKCIIINTIKEIISNNNTALDE